MKKLLVLSLALYVLVSQVAAAELTPEDRKFFLDNGVHLVDENVTYIAHKSSPRKVLGCVGTTSTKSVLYLDVTPNLFGSYEFVYVLCKKGKFELYSPLPIGPQVKKPTQT